MKSLSSLVLLVLWVGLAHPLQAQNSLDIASVADHPVMLPTNPIHSSQPAKAAASASSDGRSVSCSTETLGYTLAKSSGYQALSLNSMANTPAMGQFYDAPQDITIHGATFYAYSFFGTTINVDVEIYLSNANKVPVGSPIASASAAVSTTNPNVPANLHSVTFSQPVTVSGPYCMVVRNSTITQLGMMTNNYNGSPPDGANEWLASIEINGTWFRGNQVNINQTIPFNADALINPIVSYDLEADFAFTPNCVSPGANVFLNSGSSPIITNRMYNQNAFTLNTPSSYEWDFGDGAQATGQNQTHIYQQDGPFDISLKTFVVGWEATCSDSITKTIKGPAVVDFATSVNGFSTNFSNQTTGNHSNPSWDFGDGNTSTLPNPTHNYTSAGTYYVCLTVDDDCGTTTLCRNLAISQTALLDCGKDTVQYTMAKASSTQPYTINGFLPVDRIAQYFETPQPITVHGFDFYGWQSDSLDMAITLHCRVYKSTPDTVPDGNPILTTTFRLDSAGGGSGDPEDIRQSIIFPNAIVMDEPFFIAIENNTTTDVTVLTNDWNAGDGDQNWRSAVFTNTTGWTSSKNYDVNGVTFDADFLFEPHIEFNLDSDFDFSPELPETTLPVTFTPTSSALLKSPVYSQLAFNGNTHFGYEWDFGDGSNIALDTLPTHTYSNPGTYLVKLRNTFVGWTLTCQDSQEINVQTAPLTVSNPELGLALDIYPNPATHQLNIATSGAIPGPIRIELMDVSGRVLLQKQWNPIETGTKTLDLSTLPNGNYPIRISTDSGVMTRKITVVR